MKEWKRRSGWVALIVVALVVCGGGAVRADSFQLGGDRLVATQNADGGWDYWPDSTTSQPEIHGPVGMGLARAYQRTGDPAHLTALQKASTYLLGKTTTFSSWDGCLAATLDGILGGTANVDYVKANFYDNLAAGTYMGGYTTATYINALRTVVHTGSNANLAAWDLGVGVVSAGSCGADMALFVQGTKDEINELDNGLYYNVLGLAGGIYGLAYAGEDFDPTGGSHAAASSLDDLGVILASCQVPSTGGFTYWQGCLVPNEAEFVQETAYAMLALDELDRERYRGELLNAGGWLTQFQLATGGWKDSVYAGYVEDNQITGEAMWGLGRTPVIAEPGALGLLGLVVVGLRRRRR